MTQHVVVDIDLGAFYATDEGTTFAEVIAQMAAEKILATERSDAVSHFRRRMVAITDEEIREQIRPLIREALEAAVQPTDAFGQPKGERKTLHELVVDVARKEITMSRGDGFRGEKRTAVEDFIRVEVKQAFAKELQDTIREAKAQVLAAVSTQAGEVIADTIERLAAGRKV